jgi:all-trans-retinol 13,14-reductase
LEERIHFISIPHEGERKSSDQGAMVLCQANPKEMERWNGSSPGKRPTDYLRFKEEITARIGRHLEPACPEFEGRIRYLECCTPLTLKEKTNSPFGSLYGAKHRLEQYNPLPVTRLGNLYLAGQSIVAPGVLGAMISGFVACGSFIGHDRLRAELKRCL